MAIRKRKAKPVEPHEDYGFFGPDSVTWKVWGYSTSATIGFQRAVVVEELDPALIASVDKTQDIFTGRARATTAPCATSRWWPSAPAARPPRSPTSW